MLIGIHIKSRLKIIHHLKWDYYNVYLLITISTKCKFHYLDNSLIQKISKTCLKFFELITFDFIILI